VRLETRQLLIAGPVGQIDTILDGPASPKGIALIAHPHPLYGGTNTNKVAQTLARTLANLGYASFRPNFRGVGGSAGAHDEGRGETEDLLAVIDHARAAFGELPVVLAGFSFGAYVQARVAHRLRDAGTPPQRLILVGTAAGHVEGTRSYDTEAVPPDTLVIHGARDETVPLANALAWAEPQDLPVVVIPGADHFFHRRLHLLRDIITRAWKH
jgi:alpha/beta superfamily hydrolase